MICVISGCGQTGKLTRGYCRKHYQRMLRTGRPEISLQGGPRQTRGSRLPVRTVISRIIKLDSDCWSWDGYIDAYGYGRSRTILAHRVVYELLVGPIPAGMELDHLCHTNSDCFAGNDCQHRRCVNPAHMEIVTSAENSARAHQPSSLLSHCVQGHAYDETNTYRRPNGQRDCRACIRGRAARYRERRELVTG